MDHTFAKKSNALKGGFAIKTFSIIALVCASICFIRQVVLFRLLHLFALLYLFGDLCLLIASILFNLYIFKFYGKSKAKGLVPLVLGVIGLGVMVEFLFANNILGPYTFYYFIFSYAQSPRTVIPLVCIAILVCTALAVISALKGFHKKGLMIVSMSWGLLFELCPFVYVSYLIIADITDWSVQKLLDFPFVLSLIGGLMALLIALLLFALNNKIPSVDTASSKTEENAETDIANETKPE